MLKQLTLSNIVLVESAKISFLKGLNVISGETGAGKSAIMAAMSQIGGARADTNLIRHGAEIGIIEALFDIDKLPSVQIALKESGIEHIDGEDLLIRRELSKSGKSRLFINGQNAHLTTLRKIGKQLLEIVGQHANQRLYEIAHHQQMVDSYGELNTLRKTFTSSWEKETTLQLELQQLLDSEQKRVREIEVCKMELEELDNAALKTDEEEELFSEYTRLTNAEELAGHSQEIVDALSNTVIAALNRCKHASEDLCQLDPTLEDLKKTLHSSQLEIEELAHSYRSYNNGIEHNPARSNTINDRLSTITQMRRKYGPSIEDVFLYYDEKLKRLDELENADVEIDDLKEEIAALTITNNELATELTKKRQCIAEKLQIAMTEQLKSLNMPHAQFFVEMTTQQRTRFGDDRIEFYFAPNKGEKKVSIRECASGGEVSRLMLSLQTLLAGKAAVPTLVFDEIDANIGGQTANVVGEKLQQIGKMHQLLCITHFPQVANFADHHLQISKKEIDGRTYTLIDTLETEKREKELLRMVGK